jgi:serine/threonine protein kinase
MYLHAPANNGGGKRDVLRRVLKPQPSRKNVRQSLYYAQNKALESKQVQDSRYLQALEEARPGDGVGYPNAYNGERVRINNAFLKRCKLLRPRSLAFRFNSSIVIKTGDKARMSEAAAMRLLSECTSLPIPKVHDAYVQDDGCGVIVMEYIEGVPLDQAWPSYDQAQRSSVLAQLRSYLVELRSVTSNVISSIDGAACCDQFFATDSAKYGPYSSQDAFNEGLVDALREQRVGHQAPYDGGWFHMIAGLIRSLRGNGIVLTHNDLTPGNILVRDGKVVAILDWEMCGFYPDYWEFVKSYAFADWNSLWVKENIPEKILVPKLSELGFILHAKRTMWPRL